jgi:serine/threonine-protein phosphatase PP1 catalytic subunit
MSVSGELLCSFELLKPLDSSALKSHIKKSRNMRQSMLNSPVCTLHDGILTLPPSDPSIIYPAHILTAFQPAHYAPQSY